MLRPVCRWFSGRFIDSRSCELISQTEVCHKSFTSWSPQAHDLCQARTWMGVERRHQKCKGRIWSPKTTSGHDPQFWTGYISKRGCSASREGESLALLVIKFKILLELQSASHVTLGRLSFTEIFEEKKSHSTDSTFQPCVMVCIISMRR